MSVNQQNERSSRVAIVISSDVIGGHEMQAVELIKLAATRCQATVFVNRDNQRSLFDGIGVAVSCNDGLFYRTGKLPIQILRGFTHHRKYNLLFDQFDRVIVCAGAVEASLQVGFGLLFSGKADLYLPFIYDRRVLLGWIGLPYTCLLHLLTNLFTNLITISRIQARLISRLYFGNLLVIRNQVKPTGPVAKLNKASRLVTIGRLDRQKQIPQLIDELDFADNPFKTLLIIGDGPLRAEVERVGGMAKHIKVVILGWLNAQEQSAALVESDVLIVNSVIEGEPLVIREANARGMVVLARDIPGVRGLTRKANRYKSQSELRARLILAASRRLRVVPPVDASRLAASRDHAASRLFG